MSTKIIKRDGTIQYFDGEKLELTVIRACLNAHMSDEEGRQVAKVVLTGIEGWLQNKDDISSGEVFDKVIELLEKIKKDAAFMYKTHRDIS